MTETDWTRITAICETIWSALQKVKDEAVRSDELLIELGVTEIERELVKIDPGYAQVSPTARLDSFLTDDAYSFVELNGESPAGIAYADSATEIFESLARDAEICRAVRRAGICGTAENARGAARLLLRSISAASRKPIP